MAAYVGAFSAALPPNPEIIEITVGIGLR